MDGMEQQTREGRAGPEKLALTKNKIHTSEKLVQHEDI
jgi:hypothetical protein